MGETTRHTEALRQKLYEEHLSHLKETDDQPPYMHGSFFYYTRTVEGLSYKIHCRKPLGSSTSRLPEADAAEEIVLDINKLAEGKSHCDVSRVTPSPDHKLVAYSADLTGDEVYQVRIVDLSTGQLLSDDVQNASGRFCWGDSATIFYQTLDATKRPYKFWRHPLGTAQSD